MKSKLGKIYALVAFVALSCLFISTRPKVASATGECNSSTTPNSPDISCWQGSNAGGGVYPSVRIDVNGNLIPSQTTNAQSLGSSSLPWNATIKTLTVTGTATLQGPIVGTPGSTGITGAVTVAAPLAGVLKVHAIAGSVTDAATPAIATGTLSDGQLLDIVNVGTTGAITFQDEVGLTGSGLRLDALTEVLQPAADYAVGATGAHELHCVYSSAAQDLICH